MSNNTPHSGTSVASVALFFMLVVIFQLVFEWIFGDAIDVRYLLQAVLASAIMTVLFVVFDRWRKRR
jgi:hypothetical protein